MSDATTTPSTPVEPTAAPVEVAPLSSEAAAVATALETVDTTKYNTEIVTQVYDKLSSMIGERKFTAVNWVILIPMAMELVETVPHLRGHEKRAIVCELIARLIGEINMTPEDRVIIMAVVRTSLPTLVDTIVDGVLGKFAINVVEHVQEGTRRCFARCKSTEESQPKSGYYKTRKTHH